MVMPARVCISSYCNLNLIIGMLITHIQIETFSDLLPFVRGKVFHVTRSLTVEAIEASRAILPNAGDMASPFGNTSRGYFRAKDCVSFFDYRNCESPEWGEHAYKCLPTMPLGTVDEIALLFLAEQEYCKLISWESWKRDKMWSYRVVPYVECGYPGPTCFQRITSVLYVSKHQYHNFLPSLSLRVSRE
jgi:hypothetical protein